MEAATERERQPWRKRIPGGVLKVLRWAVLLYLVFALVCVGFFANAVVYGFYAPVAKEGAFWLIAVALVAGVAATGAFWALGRTQALQLLEDRRRFVAFAAVGVVLLFLCQLLIASGMGFIAGSDSGVLSDVPMQRQNSAYFSMHPHNLFCEGVFTLIWMAAGAVGADPSFWLVGGGCLSVAFAVGLAALVAHRAQGAVCGVAVFAIGAVWLGLSPMAQVPYTDSYGMLWPALILYLYICVADARVKWPLIAAASVVGYAVKAPALAVLGAVAVVEVCVRCMGCGSKEEHPRLNAKQAVLTIVASLLAAATAFGIVAAVRGVPDVVIDPEKEIGITHYLMMGVGYERGVYSQDAFEFSTSFSTREERAQANIEEWQRRLSAMGPEHVADLALSKMMTTLGNGSFFWGGDGIRSIVGRNPVLLSLYGLHFEEGQPAVDLLCPWNWFAQTVWYAVLAGCALNLLRRRVSRAESVVCLTLFLFCVYALIFEANPRYPFIFAPLFLMLGVGGWSGLVSRLRGGGARSQVAAAYEAPPLRSQSDRSP